MSPSNKDLAALKKFLLNDELRKANLQKMNYFTRSTKNISDAPSWFRNAVFLSFDMEWYSEWRKELGAEPPTELGFAVIYGEDVINFVNNPNGSLEDLFANIRAFHVRVIERCHMINRLNDCTDATEENFLFGITGFLTEEQVKNMIRDVFSEKSTKQMVSDVRSS